ncbi:glycosyltransferase family 2 protein [Spiribacter pallidus]|uniref:Glycosyltransferase family 2 protein n=1 Tax=Spiribacter pallidus TaxID=1987936 RepID=A0ABV3TFA1_9GAMM
MRIAAVVVGYRVDSDGLAELIDRLQSVCSATIVVINKADKAQRTALPEAHPAVDWLFNEDNRGLAFAQNQGLARARNHGVDAVLLLDQDTLPTAEGIETLAGVLARRFNDGERVAAVGPAYHQPNGGEWPGFVVYRPWGFSRVHPRGERAEVAVDFLIASGSLIPVAALDDVGDMDEGLFIDHVDTEWCLRARARGWSLVGVPTVSFSHCLGERQRRVWLGRWRSVAVYPPWRYYMMMRNSVLLYRRAGLSGLWKWGDVWRSLGLLAWVGLAGPRREASLSAMVRGAVDGWHGMTGAPPTKLLVTV